MRLAVHERERKDGQDDSTRVQRLIVGVSLSALGPIRVDMLRAGDQTTVRILVEREAVAQRLIQDSEELTRRLGSAGTSVTLHARVGTPDELALEEQARNVRFLHEHHVMEVEG